MATVLKARQGTLLRYSFAAFNPVPGSSAPDYNNPYLFTGYTARFTVKTPAPIVYTDAPNVTVQDNPGKVTIFIPATVTDDWSQGDLPFEIEMIPPEGEDYAYALVYGTITMERQSA